jgi:hypothetical protein
MCSNKKLSNHIHQWNKQLSNKSAPCHKQNTGTLYKKRSGCTRFSLLKKVRNPNKPVILNFQKICPPLPFSRSITQTRHIQFIVYTPPSSSSNNSLPPSLKQSAAMPTSDTDFDLSVRSLSLMLFHFHSLYVSLDSLSFLCSPLPHLPSQSGKFALISRVSYRFQNAHTLMLTLTVQRVYICWCE